MSIENGTKILDDRIDLRINRGELELVTYLLAMAGTGGGANYTLAEIAGQAHMQTAPTWGMWQSWKGQHRKGCAA